MSEMRQSEEHVLKMLSEGRITAEEADRLLNAIEESAVPGDLDTPITAEPVLEYNLPHISEYRRGWQLPFLGSLFVLALSGGKIIARRSRKGLLNRLSLNMYWLSFTAAALGSLFFLWSRDARWLRVKVDQADGTHVDISLPVPVHLLGWLFKTARPYVDAETARQLDTAIDMIAGMQQEMDSPGGQPIVIDVNEEGSRVQVFFI
jgi:hypothetical protein